MSVRCKMRVTGYHEATAGGYSKEIDSVTVTLQPVYGTGEDDSNKEWSKWTPSGELRLSITNPAAYKQFRTGQVVFVDLHPAD